MSKTAGSLDDGNTASIPAIQQSDINDGDILGATSSEDAGNGLMKYTMILPSGRKLETSPFQVEHKRKMMISWCDAVRQASVEDAQEKYDKAMREQRDKQMKEKALDIQPEQHPFIPEGPAYTEPVGKGSSAPSGERECAASGNDPVVLARHQLVVAHCDADHWANVELQAATKKAAAITAAAKWTRVLEVLNAS